jgi:hypothetical protein
MYTNAEFCEGTRLKKIAELNRAADVTVARATGGVFVVGGPLLRRWRKWRADVRLRHLIAAEIEFRRRYSDHGLPPL